MAPHLLKKKQQQKQQHLPDDYRRPNIWRFISSRRFGQGGRRDSADNGDEAQGSGVSGPSLEDSDESDSILMNEDPNADGESISSEYSDAHSSWELPSITREDAISLAFNELLVETDAHDMSSNSASMPEQQPLDRSSGTRDGSKDAVISIAGLPLHMDTYIARHVGPAASEQRRSTNKSEQPPEHSSGGSLTTKPRNQASSTLTTENVLGPQLDKGKEVDRCPDWTTTTNPWTMLGSNNFEASGGPDHLLEENARLRAEIQELRANASKHDDPHAIRVEPSSPRPSPTLPRAASRPASRPASRAASRAVSRAKRARHKKLHDLALFETTTLRDLVLKRLFTPHVIVDGIIRNDDTPVTLDTPLTPAQIQEFTWIMNDVITSGKHLKQPIALCAVCHLPKFKGAKSTHQNSYVSEVLAQLPTVSVSAIEDFDPVWGTSSCCRRYVCKTCLGAAIVSGISTQWWFDLSNSEGNWLKCPVPCCGRSLPLWSSRDIAGTLQELGVQTALPYLQHFERATQLRAKLQTLHPPPGKEQLRRSKVLHDRLIRSDRMWPLLEDIPGRANEETATVELFPVDTVDGRGIVQIPIFTHRLRPRIARTCVVCDETFPEFHRGNPQSWTRVVRGFGGEWTWRILPFPTIEILPDCHHDLDICRGCLAQHITTQLEMQGHSVVDNINCPALDCDHKLGHAEIRHLATPESFSIYDRYTVMNSISSLPNFRWCLREDCISGGLYDVPSSPSMPPLGDASCIECSECSFAMCYTCQSPWHAHLTCSQYASQREESFTETRSWLAQHTKPCPGQGCGVQVLKGDGCFHMTCSRCRSEFCWECLADWRGIFVPGDEGGFLRADGHGEGCFFRGEGVPLPTQVMGEDLETGLRRLEQAAD
ncbi:hypothetical protein BJ170DRAFT_624431 [Xylariales sp. AK1849]|nr:hypothetical protein BJ170DRAFT_624431 [Xylariales sp. AK1849]